MKHTSFFLLSAALLASLPSMAKSPEFPFDPDKSVLITEPDNMMTHVPSTVITSDGMVYFTYYYDKMQPKEEGLSTTTQISFDHFPLRSWRKPGVKRQLFLKCGMTIGDFTQCKYPPYDPALVDCGNGKFALLFQGYQDNGEGKSMYLRMYDRKKAVFEDNVEPCCIHYNGKKVPISNKGLCQVYCDLTGAELQNVEAPVINTQFVKEGEWWYNLIFCFPSPQSRPIVVRTKDFINYEMLFICKEFSKGSCEGSLAIYGNEFFIIARSSRPESGRGTYMAKYSREGECIVPPYLIGEIESRPLLVVFKEKLYAFYNAGPELMTPDGKVRRSRMRISEIDGLANPVRSWDITNSTGIHYYYVTEHKGSLYMTFVSGRTPRDYKQIKGDISFGKVNL